ncbi:hypothetical protein [Variovorax sp. ZT4R33]|uniref:hypothetical protein n=1 Tax=Variovorax sp. ZT4R33 TaxID=3443743 RepID=UPI003F450D07
MGIALLTFVDLLTPLQSLASRWLPERRTRRSRTGLDLQADLRYVAVRPACGQRAVTPLEGLAQNSAVTRALRVVRTVDAHQPGRRAGRVVISGRMADVCAELDRLAALEAADTVRGTRPLH